MNLPISHVQSSSLSCHLWVETLTDGQVLAWVGEWPECRVTADSRDRAIEDLEQLLQARMGAIEVLSMNLPFESTEQEARSAIADLPKISKTDPYFIEFMAQLRADRALEDDNPAYTIDW
jgi:hypothetical protein